MRELWIGERARGGYRFTLDAAPGADFQAYVPPLPADVRVVRWDRIVMVHFLEHIYVWEAHKLLRECHEVLTESGELVIECPDISQCAKVLIGLETAPDQAQPGQFDMWGLYGNPEYQDPLYIHKWGWTPTTLSEALVQAGFAAEKVQVVAARYHHPGRDFRVEAIR